VLNAKSYYITAKPYKPYYIIAKSYYIITEPPS